MTHRSYAYENGGLPTNERLEFLGDSVLGVVITEELYRRHPDLPEGQLAKLRAAIVNSRALAGVGRGDRARALPQARPRRAGQRRPRQVLDHRRRRRGGDRRLLPRPGSRADPRAGAAAVRRRAGRRREPRRRPGLEDLAAGARRGAVARRTRSTSSSRAARTTRRRSTPRSCSPTLPVGEGRGNSKKEAEQLAAEQAWTALTADVTK